MRQRGVLDWTPDPIGEALQNLEKRTIDSEMAKGSDGYTDWASVRLGSVAIPEKSGQFTSFHVTDDPPKVEEILSGDYALSLVKPWGSLCAGLYVTLSTASLERVSSKSYGFLATLTIDQREILWKAIREELFRRVTTSYITHSEHENAMNQIDAWLNKGHDYGIYNVVNQPYNIDVKALASSTGVATPFQPSVVAVTFDGRYLDLTDEDTHEEAAFLASKVLGKESGALTEPEVCDVLHQHWDGAFTRSGFNTSPQLSIWGKERVISFGGYKRG